MKRRASCLLGGRAHDEWNSCFGQALGTRPDESVAAAESPLNQSGIYDRVTPLLAAAPIALLAISTAYIRRIDAA
jgi:hypothetical protein